MSQNSKSMPVTPITPIEEEQESFVARWSRRKEQAKQDIDEANVSPQQIEDEKVETEVLSPEQQRLEKLNVLTDDDMPELETLNEESDYSGFMSINVSEELRKLALKKLFHSETYNVRDGLDEYDGDYTSFEKLDPSIITADMRHMLEVEAEKLRAEKEKQDKEESENSLLENNTDDQENNELEESSKKEDENHADSNTNEIESTNDETRLDDNPPNSSSDLSVNKSNKSQETKDEEI